MHSSRPRICTIGEVLWDMFPSGPRFGGAPANFGYHAAALGADVTILSAVGNDTLGDQAQQILDQSQIHSEWVARISGHATGQVNVDIDSKGHASYSFNENEAWDHIPWSDQYLPWLTQVDAVCFGTLAQRSERSRDTIYRVLEHCHQDAFKILDLNLRPPYVSDDLLRKSLEAANALKINDDELQVLARFYGLHGTEIELAQAILSKCSLRWLALTRGPRGGVLVTADQCDEQPAQPITLVDTVGAGDSFTAAVVVGFLTQQPVSEINRYACRIAEFVCSQRGATPTLPRNLIPTWVSDVDERAKAR